MGTFFEYNIHEFLKIPIWLSLCKCSFMTVGSDWLVSWVVFHACYFVFNAPKGGYSQLASMLHTVACTNCFSTLFLSSAEEQLRAKFLFNWLPILDIYILYILWSCVFVQCSLPFLSDFICSFIIALYVLNCSRHACDPSSCTGEDLCFRVCEISGTCINMWVTFLQCPQTLS